MKTQGNLLKVGQTIKQSGTIVTILEKGKETERMIYFKVSSTMKNSKGKLETFLGGINVNKNIFYEIIN